MCTRAGEAPQGSMEIDVGMAWSCSGTCIWARLGGYRPSAKPFRPTDHLQKWPSVRRVAGRVRQAAGRVGKGVKPASGGSDSHDERASSIVIKATKPWA